MLKGLAAAGVVAGAAGWLGRTASASDAVGADPSTAWGAFDAAVASAFRRMRMVGAAVAVVSSDRVLHTSTLGVRSLTGAQPVSEDTHFLAASTTKSMSSLLVATYVDQGKLNWNQPVIDAWPAFRAPTDALTRTLRVRDLLGMASGIGEPAALSALHEGDVTAAGLLQSIATLPVIDQPNERFFCNNTVYALGVGDAARRPAHLPVLSRPC